MTTYTNFNSSLATASEIAEYNTEFNGLMDSLVQDCIDFLSVPHYNRSKDSEWYFYQKEEFDYIMAHINPKLACGHEIYDHGELFGYVFRPIYQKRTRAKKGGI